RTPLRLASGYIPLIEDRVSQLPLWSLRLDSPGPAGCMTSRHGPCPRTPHRSALSRQLDSPSSAEASTPHLPATRSSSCTTAERSATNSGEAGGSSASRRAAAPPARQGGTPCP